jgi:tape measure domain-containing protein
MTNTNTELLIRIKTDLGKALSDFDQMSGGIGGVGRTAQQTTSKVAAMMAALSNQPSLSAIKLTAGMDAAGRSSAAARAEIQRVAEAAQAAQQFNSARLTAGMDAAGRAASAAREEIERTASAELALANASRGLATEQVNLRAALSSAFSGAPESVGATGAAIAGLKAQLLGLVAVYKVLEGGKNVIEKTADLQDVETRLQSLTATAEKYAETEQYLTETADRLHKQFIPLSESYTRLLALQREGIITQKEGRTILEGMANASADLGVSNADLDLSMRGIIQQLGNSNVQWDEMRQATDPIPGLLQNIAKASGRQVGELKAMSEAGGYTTAMFRDHLIKALTNYEGAAERTGKNIHAQYTDVENAYTRLVKVLEHPISDVLTPLLNGIANRIEQIANGPSLQDKIDELNMLKAASSKDAPRFLSNSTSPDQDEIRRRRGATGAAPQDRIAQLEAEIAAIQKKNAANKDALEQQDKQEKADRAAAEAKKAMTDAEDWYYEVIIDDEKKAAKAKEEATKKAQQDAKSKAEQAANTYAREREAIAKHIDQLNFELAALKLSDEERAIQIKVRSLSAKATDEEREKIESGVRALDKATAAQKRLNEAKEQQVKDAWDHSKLYWEIQSAATAHNQSLDSLSNNIAKIDDMLNKDHRITPEQAKEMYDMLGKGFNDGFIAPAKEGTSSLSEFSVQAAHNMQSAFADFLFDPFQNGVEGMGANFARIVQRMVAEAASAQIFEALLGKNFGKDNATGGLLSALFSGVAGAFGGMFDGGGSVSVANGNSAGFTDMMNSANFWTKHSGGIVGQASSVISADPRIFSSATRYHNGGIPGLKPNEVPIIALDDEEVLTRNDPRHRYNLGKNASAAKHSDAGINITTQVNVSTDGSNGESKDMGAKLGNMVNAVVRQVIITEKRPGGLLAQGS